MSDIDKQVQVGGNGGTPFKDSEDEINIGFISKIDVRYGKVIDNLRLSYGNSPASQHGGGGGSADTFVLEPGERIIRVEGSAGDYIDSLQFFTDKGKQSPKYGGGGGTPFQAEASVGGQLITIEGRAGDFIDQVTLSFGPPYYISNFRYDLENVTRNSTPDMIAHQTLENHTNTEQTATYSETITIRTEKTVSFEAGQKFGVSATLTTGIPIVAEGEVTISSEVSFEEGVIDKSSQSTEENWSIPVTVPPNTTIEATSSIQRHELTVPFAYDVVWYVGDRSNEIGRQTFNGYYHGVNVTDLTHDFRTL